MLIVVFWLLVFYLGYKLTTRSRRPNPPPPVQQPPHGPPPDSAMNNISDAKFEELPPDTK